MARTGGVIDDASPASPTYELGQSNSRRADRSGSALLAAPMPRLTRQSPVLPAARPSRGYCWRRGKLDGRTMRRSSHARRDESPRHARTAATCSHLGLDPGLQECLAAPCKMRKTCRSQRAFVARPERFELPTFGSVDPNRGCGRSLLLSVCPANRRFRRVGAARRLRRFPDSCLSWCLS